MNTQPEIKIEIDTINGHKFRMIEIIPMSFMMGDDNSEYDDEKPAHKVHIKQSYYMAEFPVTQALWKAVVGEENNPSYFIGDNRPVEMVSWDDIKEKFLPAINKMTDKTYRLPTEAEWEFAAKGGVLSKGYEYSGSNRLKEVGWYGYYDKSGNSHGETMPVGMKLPNELGLYDMSGNVFEWCEDVWHGNYKGAPDDGTAWIDGGNDGKSRLVRGGSWGSYDYDCRVSYRHNGIRNGHLNSVGFRLVLY